MNLLQRLQQADYQAVAIRGEADISYRQLIDRALQLRQQYPALQYQAIALPFDNLPSFTVALLAFDGWCRALYLLPDNTPALPEQVIHWPAHNPAPRTFPTPAETTRWYLATSGTTGTPKWIAHSFVSLSQAVKVSPGSTALCWALCYQPDRFAGLQVLLQSLLSGACITDCCRGEAEQRLKLMLQHGVNALSATPSLWRQLLMTNHLAQLPLKQLTLGGEIADQSLLNTLSAMYPDARVLHIYASTEAGVGFAVADKQAGFPSVWLTNGHNNLALKIDEQQHLWLKPITAPDHSLTARIDTEGYLDTEDLVSIQGDRILFLGRASGVINVGGNKVHPEQVEQVLLQVTGVTQAKVSAKASSVLGQLVVADIVAAANANHTQLQALLFKHCQQHLARYQIPTRFNFVDNLSTNTTGKLSRKEPHG